MKVWATNIKKLTNTGGALTHPRNIHAREGSGWGKPFVRLLQLG